VDFNDHFEKGYEYYCKMQYDKAISEYSQAISLNPKDASAYCNRGNAYFKKKKYTKAILDYTRSINLNQNEANVIYTGNRGLAYYNMRKYKLAIVDLEAALKLDPSNTKFKNVLLKAENKQKNHLKNIGLFFISNKIVFISTLLSIFSFCYFFIEGYTPDITKLELDHSYTTSDGAILFVPSVFKVKKFDRQSVSWKSEYSADGFSVILPPGEHSFMLFYHETRWAVDDTLTELVSDVITLENVDLMPGKYYRLEYSYNEKLNCSILESDVFGYEKSGFHPKFFYLIVSVVSLGVVILFFFLFLKGLIKVPEY
jgi:tetratricopeptide (TPR) repeat protein